MQWMMLQQLADEAGMLY